MKLGQIITVRGMQCRVITIEDVGTYIVESLDGQHQATATIKTISVPVVECWTKVSPNSKHFGHTSSKTENQQ